MLLVSAVLQRNCSAESYGAAVQVHALFLDSMANMIAVISMIQTFVQDGH